MPREPAVLEYVFALPYPLSDLMHSHWKAGFTRIVRDKEARTRTLHTSRSQATRGTLSGCFVVPPPGDVCRPYQEFSRVLKGDGVVVVTLWERHEGSIFQRMRNVLETLVPGKGGWFVLSNYERSHPLLLVVIAS